MRSRNLAEPEYPPNLTLLDGPTSETRIDFPPSIFDRARCAMNLHNWCAWTGDLPCVHVYDLCSRCGKVRQRKHPRMR